MTQEQIIKYTYCEKYMKQLESKMEAVEEAFPSQNFGCSSGSPTIEYTLEKIHRKTYDSIRLSIRDAMKEVQTIIDSI
jgi:hypothetical protein